MKTRSLLLVAGLAGLSLFSCNEELDIRPVPDQDLKASSLEGENGRTATSTTMDVIDFEAYSAGTIVTEVYGANGSGPVKVSGNNPRFPGKEAAMIFNSSAPTGFDLDLGSPNKDFGGPGVGVGGQAGSAYENNVSLGKVLIITEDFDTTDPDDGDVRGSTFTFDFSALNQVTVYSMHIMDVESVENTAKVSFYDSAGTMIGTQYGLPKTGDNGLHNYFFGSGVTGVAKMVVYLNGSGAIDNIVFSTEEILPPPTEGGCTYTQGYWKNHTKYSRAKRDATWDKIGPQGEDTPFFLSGQSYIEVLKAAPKGGNAYYILAHQYIAAKLNILKGAGAPTEVQDAVKESESLFNKYTPAQIGALKGGNALRARFIELADLLDRYNNGLIGPGHCD